MKRLVEEMVRNKWNMEWNEYEEGKHSKEFLVGNDKNKAKKLLELSRYEVSRYICLVTGHIVLNWTPAHDELAKAGAVCDNTVAVLPPKI